MVRILLASLLMITLSAGLADARRGRALTLNGPALTGTSGPVLLID